MFDTATGLQNNLNRWYDAKAGRWISEDPISFAAGDANIYRYVGNGATNWIDPDGLAAVELTPKKPNPSLKKDKTLKLNDNEKKFRDAVFKCKLKIWRTGGKDKNGDFLISDGKKTVVVELKNENKETDPPFKVGPPNKKQIDPKNTGDNGKTTGVGKEKITGVTVTSGPGFRGVENLSKEISKMFKTAGTGGKKGKKK